MIKMKPAFKLHQSAVALPHMQTYGGRFTFSFRKKPRQTGTIRMTHFENQRNGIENKWLQHTLHLGTLTRTECQKAGGGVGCLHRELSHWSSRVHHKWIKVKTVDSVTLLRLRPNCAAVGSAISSVLAFPAEHLACKQLSVTCLTGFVFL